MRMPLSTFSIQEVSQRLSLTKHTLRFWEKELEGVLIPLRSKGGQRRYTEEHLIVIEEIGRLKRLGFSLAEIKTKLRDRYESQPPDKRIDQLAVRIAELVRTAIYNFLVETNQERGGMLD